VAAVAKTAEATLHRLAAAATRSGAAPWRRSPRPPKRR
jgi:hypothetical protein